MKQVALLLLQGVGVFALCRRLTRGRLRILAYHGLYLGGPPHYGDCLFMQPESFVQRMRWLARSRYRVLPLDEALRHLEHGTLPPNAVALTIDDGWYGSYRGMIPVLARVSLPATFYVTTEYVVRGGPVLDVLIGYLVARARPSSLLRAQGMVGTDSEPAALRDSIAERLVATAERLPVTLRPLFVGALAEALDIDLGPILRERLFDLMNEEELRAVRAEGFDVQLHTHTHRMHGLASAQVGEEIERNRAQLARILDCPPETFKHLCFPSGEYSPSIFATLRERGVESATTTEYGLVHRRSTRLGLPRILDRESMSVVELEARLCGFWELIHEVRRRGRRLARGSGLTRLLHRARRPIGARVEQR